MYDYANADEIFDYVKSRTKTINKFKDEVIKVMVEKMQVDEKYSFKVLYDSDVSDMINSDLAWSVSMGAEFWAKEIIRNGY